MGLKLVGLLILVFVAYGTHAVPTGTLLLVDHQKPNNFLFEHEINYSGDKNTQKIIQPLYLGLSIAVSVFAGSFNNKWTKEYLFSKKYFCTNKTPYPHTNILPRLCIH